MMNIKLMVSIVASILMLALAGCGLSESETNSDQTSNSDGLWERVEAPHVERDILRGVTVVQGVTRYNGSERLTYVEITCHIYRDNTQIDSAVAITNGLLPNTSFAWEAILGGLDYSYWDNDSLVCPISFWQ